MTRRWDYAPERNYDFEWLGDRATAIPGSEPRLNPAASRQVPVCSPDLSEIERQYVAQAMQSGWISSKGEFVQRFEDQFAAAETAQHGCAVNSGTNAIYLALAAIGIGPGDEVIVPTFTMVATANAVRYLGAQPVFVDCDNYYQICVQDLPRALTPRTRAIIPVHVYGHPVDLDGVEAFAGKHGLAVIYDAAEAHGTTYKNRRLGGRGLAVCYSFFANKTITTGEGGMVLSSDPQFMRTCRNLRDMSFSTERHFWHRRLGFNFRMTNVSAAIGCGQLERFDELVAARRRNAAHYREALAGIAGIAFQPQRSDCHSSHWMVGIQLDSQLFGRRRDAVRHTLAGCGVETRTYFVPMHLQPLYFNEHGHGRFPNAERLSEQGLYLPSGSNLTETDRDYVITAMLEMCNGVRAA